MTGRMHEGEVAVDAGVVGRLVAGQFPELADRPVAPFASTGTVNAIYRLGDDLYVRLPRIERWSEDLDLELEWLPRLGPHLPLRVPEPIAEGEPADGYPFRWAIYRWIEGRPYEPGSDDELRAADDLARFVLALRAIDDTTSAPPTGRRPLRQLEGTRQAIEASHEEIDTPAALGAWERALDAPPWDGTPVWIHNDLLPPNLLVDEEGRLTAVLDFGSAGVGDPAADVVPAWSVLGPAGRASYRAALAVDDATWERARGYALHQAAMIVPYYRVTNPGFVTMAVRTIGQVVADSPP